MIGPRARLVTPGRGVARAMPGFLPEQGSGIGGWELAGGSAGLTLPGSRGEHAGGRIIRPRLAETYARLIAIEGSLARANNSLASGSKTEERSVPQCAPMTDNDNLPYFHDDHDFPGGFTLRCALSFWAAVLGVILVAEGVIQFLW
jgi:hypothetical protein